VLSLFILSKAKICVVTGGPGSGKTELIEGLAEKSYNVIPEVAGFLIKEALNKGEEHPIKNPKKFQRDIFEKQLELENNVKSSSFALIDRGLLDGFAYYKLNGICIPFEFLEKMKNHKRYDYVIFLEFPPDELYAMTEIRTEPLVVARHIHELIKEVYLEYGYKLIYVPFFEDQSCRVDYVCDLIESKLKD
jgi:predicted ATPase